MAQKCTLAPMTGWLTAHGMRPNFYSCPGQSLENKYRVCSLSPFFTCTFLPASNMHFSEIETLTYYRDPAGDSPSQNAGKPFAEIAWSDLPDKVRRTIRAAGALSLEGDYPDSLRKAKIETEVAVFSGSGKLAKIVARDRRVFELIEDHVVHTRVAAVFRAIESAVFANAIGGDASVALLDDLPEPPEMPPVPDWLERIEFARRPYVDDDFKSVLAKGSEAACALCRVVEWAAANPDVTVALPDDYALLINAFLLLGDLRDKGSFPTIVRFISTPESVCDNALGDLITEELPEILARTYDGDFTLLAGLIENRDAYEYCRLSAVDALACLFWDGVLPRERVASYLGDLLGLAVSQEDMDMCGVVANAVADLRFEELSEPVQRAFREGLIHPGDIDEMIFLKIMRSSYPSHRHIAPDEPLWSFQMDAYWLTQQYLTDQSRGSRSRLEESESQKNHPLREIGSQSMPFLAPQKIGRNDPCPCGSGKKYKKCCIALG